MNSLLNILPASTQYSHNILVSAHGEIFRCDRRDLGAVTHITPRSCIMASHGPLCLLLGSSDYWVWRASSLAMRQSSEGRT